jgi:uncharacterized cupredoxin-like copper-binding protein
MKRILGPIAVALALAACSSSSPSTTPSTNTPSPPPSSANVVLKDFAVSVDPTTVAAGAVTFNLTNTGPSVHEFVIFKTLLAPDALPLAKDGTGVSEDDPQVEHITEKEDIKVGTPATLDATLVAGKYVLICNLPGHYKAGMHAPLTVA